MTFSRLLLALLCSSAWPHALAAAGRDLTVRLYFGHLPQHVELSPAGGADTLRRCSRCKPEPVAKALQIASRGSQLLVMPAPVRARSRVPAARDLLLHGAFRLHSGGQPDVLASGDWNIAARATGLTINLTLPVDSYVAAALNGETAKDESLESLKAMAVITRTYALENARRHHAEGFDLCDSTHCQVLRFAAPRPLVQQAVAATSGETLRYGGEPAQVFFHQHCGGQTANASDVWPQIHQPYLRSVVDPYCVRRDPFRWTLQLSKSDIAAPLRQAGYSGPRTISSLSISSRTSSHRVRSMLLVGPDNSTTMDGDRFRLAVDAHLGSNQLRSDLYDLEDAGPNVIFRGSGGGHGVGLCQFGAAEMAAEGKSYREILAFYFPGTSVTAPAGARVRTAQGHRKTH